MSKHLMMVVDRVEIFLDKLDVPIIHYKAHTYEKGSMFCVRTARENLVFKYPINNIYRVIETYGAFEYRSQADYTMVDDKGNPA